MLFKTGHTQDAHTAYDRALETLPGYHRAYAALGRFCASAGEYQRAIESFKKAQAVIPLPDYAAALATLYARLGKPAEAARQSQLLDVIDVEEPATTVLARVRDEEAAAHVGVQGGQLDAEAPRRLLTLEHPGHGSRLGTYIDLINIYTHPRRRHDGRSRHRRRFSRRRMEEAPWPPCAI